MKRIGIVGSGLVGALAASAILASTAVAVPYSISALPQLGRCVKVAEGTGEWMGKHCGVIAAPGTGSYNFEQGPGATPGFEGVLEGLTVGEAVKLQTANAAHLISCSNSEVKGEYTGVKAEKVKVELLVCTLSGKICTGEAGFQEGEIHFSAESSWAARRNGSSWLGAAAARARPAATSLMVRETPDRKMDRPPGRTKDRAWRPALR